jgi:hypothetical protein
MRIPARALLPATRLGRHVAIAVVLALCLTGCTIGSAASSTTTSAVLSSRAAAAPSAGEALVVTIPELGPVAAAPSRSSHRSTPSRLASATTSVPATRPASPTAVRATRPAAPTSARSTTAAPTHPKVTASPSSAPSSIATVSSAPTAVATMQVTLANCPGCTVLATHASVTSTLGAALVATGAGRAALLALRGDGSVAGAANVTYGASFATPPGGQLGCDSNGRCIVIAKQADGTAIASAYQVGAGGSWVDVTGQAGISSATADARTLPVGPGVGVAVQDKADGSTVWIVYGWDGDGYSVTGCTAAATPGTAGLSMSACLS